MIEPTLSLRHVTVYYALVSFAECKAVLALKPPSRILKVLLFNSNVHEHLVL